MKENSTERVKLFADRNFYHKLLTIMFPIALQSLMLSAVAAADAIMLGRIEQDSMAAVSLATQVQFIQNMIITAYTGAAAILGAQYYGKGDLRTINDIFCMSLRLVTGVSLLFFVLCFFFPEYLMMLFAADPALIEIGAGYLRLAGWSYLITGFSQCYLTIMKVTGHPGTTALVSSCTVLLNIVLNGILIFGLFGITPMGARGAALATLIARIVELVWAIAISYKKGYMHPDFGRFFARNPLLARDFRKCYLPLIGGGLFWGVGFTSFTAIMGHLGSDAAAANSMAAVVRDLICCVCNGIASAGGIMVGNELGAGKQDRGKVYGICLAKLSFVIGFGSTFVILLLTPAVLHYMQLTPQAMEYLLYMMVIMAIYMIGRCVNTIIINGVFAAGGDTLFDMYSLAATMWGVALPLAFLGAFVFHWPVPLVYACTCLDEVGKIPWVIHHFRRYKWVKDLTRTQGEML